MFRFALSLLASALLVTIGTEAFAQAIAPTQPKIIATVVAHAHAKSAWVATDLPHGL